MIALILNNQPCGKQERLLTNDSASYPGIIGGYSSPLSHLLPDAHYTWSPIPPPTAWLPPEKTISPKHCA